MSSLVIVLLAVLVLSYIGLWVILNNFVTKSTNVVQLTWNFADVCWQVAMNEHGATAPKLLPSCPNKFI